MRIGNCRRGFALIELILYTGITAMVVVALTRAMLTILSTRERVESVSAVQQELRFAMDRVAFTIRQARSIEREHSRWDHGEGVLSLAMSDAAVHPTVFSLSGSRIVVREGSGASLPLTSPRMTIDELLFRDFGSGAIKVVKVRMQGHKATAGEQEDKDAMTLETAVTLRQ